MNMSLGTNCSVVHIIHINNMQCKIETVVKTWNSSCSFQYQSFQVCIQLFDFLLCIDGCREETPSKCASPYRPIFSEFNGVVRIIWQNLVVLASLFRTWRPKEILNPSVFQSSFFSKWRDFRPIWWIKWIEQDHPFMNMIELQSHTSTENSSVQWLRCLIDKQAIWVEFLLKSLIFFKFLFVELV